MTTNNANALASITDQAAAILQIADRAASMLEICAERLGDLRHLTADIAVERDLEGSKREVLSLLSGSEADIMAAINVVENGTVDPKELASEIYEALRIRAHVLFAQTDSTAIVDILRERANNIAMAYASRLAKEPK